MVSTALDEKANFSLALGSPTIDGADCVNKQHFSARIRERTAKRSCRLLRREQGELPTLTRAKTPKPTTATTEKRTTTTTATREAAAMATTTTNDDAVNHEPTSGLRAPAMSCAALHFLLPSSSIVD